MAERQIGHRKSSLVLFAHFPVVKWRSRSVFKSAEGLSKAQAMKNSTAEREVAGSIPGTDRDRTDTLSEKWEMKVTPLPHNGQTFARLG